MIVRNRDQNFTEMWWQAAKIGQDHLIGQLRDGVETWRADGRPVSTIDLTDAQRIGDRAVLDIREETEYATGHIPGGPEDWAHLTGRELETGA